MRKILLTLALLAAVVLPVVAQFRPGMGGGMSGDALLTNKGVQKELKLTEDQVKELTEMQTKQRETMKEAFKGIGRDFEKMQEAFQKVQAKQAEALKPIVKGLTSEQAKRLAQIQVQIAAKNKDVKIFQSEPVVKMLDLTTKQKDMVKETIDGIAKDRKELRDDAKGDPTKMRALRTKMGELNTEGFEKIVKELTDTQKKAWEDQGDKFELKFERPGGGRPGKDKAKPKEDF